MNKEQFLEMMEKQLLRLPKSDRDDILSDYEDHFVHGLADGLSEEEVSAQLGNPEELALTYLENLPEGAKGAPYVAPAEEQPAADSYIPTEVPPVTEHSFGGTPTYGQPQPQQSAGYETPTYGSQPYTYTHTGTDTPVYGRAQEPAAAAAGQPGQPGTADKAGMIVLVVLLSVFVALPIVGGIIGAWFSIMGIAIAAAAAGIGLIAAGIAATVANGLLAAGLCLLGVAGGVFSALMWVGLVAAIKGVIWLVKWYVGICKKIINGGAF